MGMSRDEFALIVKGLRSVYPYDSFIKDKDAFNMWYSLLKDLDYKQASAGAIKYMQTNNKIPTPADIRNASVPTSDMSEGEAWGIVLKAIGRSAYYSKEEFDKLPSTIRRAVGCHENLQEWSQAEIDSMSVIQSQFLNSYRKAKQNDRETELMSPKLKDMIAQCADKLAIPVEGEKDYYYPMMNEPEV